MGSAPSVNFGDIASEASALSGQQEQFDIANAEAQQAANQVGQVTPFGTLSYQQTGVGPNGVPTYTASTTLSPQEQYLLTTGQGTQGQAATGANELLTGANYGATNPVSAIGDMSSGLTGEQMGAFLQGEEPFFNYQTEGLESTLANQGETPGTPAYDMAMNQLRQNQGQTVSTAESQFEPAAFGQAQSLYQEPLSIASSLYGIGNPASLESNLVSTPQTGIQVPSTAAAYGAAAGPVEQQANLQEQQFGSTMTGLGQLGGAVLGGILPSDERLKEDITPIGSTKSGIPVVYFKFKHDKSEHVGMLAQDVEKVHPDCVYEDQHGIKYLDYDEVGRREAA